MLKICLLFWLFMSAKGFLPFNREYVIKDNHMERDIVTLFGSSLDNKDEERPVSSLATPRPSSSNRIPNNSRRVNRTTTRGKPPNKGNNSPLQSLNINLDSLAKSNQPGSASRAHELLLRIEALHQEGYYAVAPDIVSLNSVLNASALSNEPFAAEKALPPS
jgi:hypothetical protein